MNSLEQKEIRGLNLKSLYWIAASCIVCVSTVLYTYFSLVSRLSAGEIRKQEQERYDDLRIRTIDLNLKSVEIEVKEQGKRLDEIERIQLRGNK